MPKLPTGTVTFLFTDVEGSTRVLRELGAERYAEALAEHRRVLREAFGAYGGVEVDTQGDALFYAFAQAADALAAAEQGQAALGAGPVRVRMGVHTGEALLAAEGYVGFEVHKGARVAATGHGGQVVVSEATRLAAGCELRPLGAHRLKDLAAPEPLWQLGDREFPPLASLNQTNLPVQPAPLIGRRLELAEAGELLRERRLVTLVGPGGSGKTRLALQLAAETVEDFPHGVWWVPLQALRDPALVVPTIASALGAKGELVEHLAGKRLLLLLDNMEQLVDAAADLAGLLAGAADLKLLVTSREPLRIAGEAEYAVDPLPDADAVALFRERAAVAEPAEAVLEICRRLDSLPLAIELAAARTKLLPPEQLLARMEQRLPLLTGGRRDAPDRQRTLRATIEWSYELLPDDERELYARLAVFAGSFDLDAAEGVCAATPDTLQSLVEKSLVRRWASGRLGLLETIREFGLERLAERGERDAIARAHWEHFLSLAEAAERSGEDYAPGWLDRLDAERDNFRTAMRWALDEQQPVLALQLASALGRLWVIRAHQEGYAWLSEALAAAESAAPELKASGLMWAGSTVFFSGDYEEAKARFEQALPLFRSLDDKLSTARILDRLAGVYGALGDAMRARTLADESLALFVELGDPTGRLYALSKVASDEWRRGDRERGLALTEEALALARGIDSWWAAGLLATLSEMIWKQGDLERATALACESVVHAHELQNMPTLIYGLALRAALAAEYGDPALAGLLWGAVEAIEARGEANLEAEDRMTYEEAVGANADAKRDAYRAEGRAMTLDEAVNCALADA